jgi:hypothetical protein
MTHAVGAAPTFFLATATNSHGFTNTGLSHISRVSLGRRVSAVAPEATVLAPIGITLRALVVAASAVARDTAVCQKLRVHTSL